MTLTEPLDGVLPLQPHEGPSVTMPDFRDTAYL